jgi:hypothetical protein
MADFLGKERDYERPVEVRWADQGDGTYAKVVLDRNMVWDPGSLAWVKMTQPGASGGGGAVTIADGADVAQGTTTDAAWSSGAGTVIALLKKIAGGAASDVTDRVGRLLGIVTIANVDVALSTRTKPSDQQHAIIDSGTVTVSNPTTNPETGLAKDATLTTNIGSVSAALSDPAVGTELDRLSVLHKDDLIVIGLLRQAVAALTPVQKKVAAPASLLHGR